MKQVVFDHILLTYFMILYNTTGMSHLKVPFSRNYLQTVRHWRTPQAVIFDFPTNGTPVEGAPSCNIQFSRKLPTNGTPLEDAPSCTIRLSTNSNNNMADAEICTAGPTLAPLTLRV